MSKLDENYIVGLVDGEGSFTAYVKNPNMPNQTKRRVIVEPRFYIKLVAKDKDILYQLKTFFGCGNVYFQRDSRPNHQDCYRYEVTNRQDLKKIIIPFFKTHKLRFETKKKDFLIFSNIVDMVSKGSHLTNNGLRRIHELKTQMH